MIGNLLKVGKVKKEDVVEAQMLKEVQTKLKLGLMVMERYADIEKVLSRFRKGDAVVLVKVAPLRNKNMNELRKAVDRMKTHCGVTGSDLAALDDNWLVLVPPVVELSR